jgi:hypothetical protein
MIRSILYVSTSRLVMPAAEVQVQAIVDWSRHWNEGVGITGALIFTERHFSQFIEGPFEAIADLFAKLQRDPRHEQIHVVRDGMAHERNFDGWNLVYSGPEMFLEPQLLPLLTLQPGFTLEKAADDLILLMKAFTTPVAI